MNYRSSGLMLLAVLAFAAPHACISASIQSMPEGSSMPDKEVLAQRLAPDAKEAAAVVRDPKTTIEPLPTPFFSNGAIYRVINLSPPHPAWFTVGCAGQHLNVFLAMNPSGFMELASHAGLLLTTDPERLKYLMVFLESTRDVRKRFQILNGVADIPIISRPDDAETARYQALVEKYRPVIQPAKLSGMNPARAVVFALVGQALVKIKLALSNTGAVERSDELLEDNLPINYAK